jgi:DNA polymerase elongation subunit (family B)
MYPAPRYFYVPDPDGEYTTITDVKVKKLVFDTRDEFEDAKKRYRVRFESDFQPEARLLMDEYYGRPTPIVHYAFLDIEVDYSAKIGWSSPENPYAAINAIPIYQSWTGKYLTYAVPPKGWDKDEPKLQAEIKRLWAEHKIGFEPDVTICKNERELLLYMLGDIEDADIISGWNSEFFDNPYIIKRLDRVLGKRGMSAMSFKGAAPPKEKVVNRFGSPAITYTLYGRTHLDYLDLFKKFTFEGRVSYSLANIAADELDTPKLDYPGTLEQLYNNDFAHFITYNARDVEVIVQLDRKFKLMQLVNQMAHENTVPFLAILGTVRYVETGITNRAHNVHHRIVTDKVIPDGENAKVEGAIVMTPRAGLWEWLGSVDITSLYPSTDRALNMSIETFIGQFEQEERAWEGIRAKDNNLWDVEIFGEQFSMTGADWHAFIREQNYALSAFGTLFDQNKPGMLSDTLTFWFEERIRLQAEKKKYAKLADSETDPEKKKEFEKLVEHYDLLQLTKKIQLNSAYGATLNEAFRFGRREIGASITGTGRQITKHMGQTIAHTITQKAWQFEKRFAWTKGSNGVAFVPSEAFSKAQYKNEWDWIRSHPTVPTTMKKFSKDAGREVDVLSGAIWFTECPAIIYGDTDSCYFLTYGTGYEDAVQKADEIARITNASFPAFMAEAFNCTGGREKLIKAAREIVAERGLFMFAKKKYTLKVVNLDGKDLRAKPKQKSMGSEIKKADTPKVVQEFLKELMDLVLVGESYTVIEKFVNSHRGKLIGPDTDVLGLAPAKQVNNLDTYYAEYKRTEKVGNGKCKLPGHVRAAVNYNELIEMYDPEGALKPLRAGDKAAILYLRPNHLGFKSVGFPPDMLHLPEWFKQDFQVDLVLTEEKMIDSKIDGIFEALGEEMPTPQNSFLNSTFTF